MEAEQGQAWPELTGGRYAVVDFAAPAPGASTVTVGAVEGAGEKAEGAEDHSFGVIGTAPSFYQALDPLGEALGCDAELAELNEEEWAVEIAAELGMNAAVEEEGEDDQGIADSNSELVAVCDCGTIDWLGACPPDRMIGTPIRPQVD